MKRLIILLSAGGLVLGIAHTVWAVTPKNGVYQGIINGTQNTNGHNEGEGFFRVKSTSTGGKRSTLWTERPTIG
jgi:hypothetical protein